MAAIFKILKNSQNHRKPKERRSSSTSYSSGNQVDGSPLVAIIAMPARVGPRTQIVSTIKELVWMENIIDELSRKFNNQIKLYIGALDRVIKIKKCQCHEKILA